MNYTHKLSIICLSFLFFMACSDDDEQITITTEDFTTTIDENPEQGLVLGTLSATTNVSESVTFDLVSSSIEGAFNLSATGELSVADPALFDFEQNAEITATANAMVMNESESIAITINLNDVNEEADDFNIWDGPSFVFEKVSGTDPNMFDGQDRITDLVWITRGNEGGEIYNAVTETESTQNVSPAGTEWAQGTTSNISNLSFQSFRQTISPRDVVGVDLVLHLIEEDIYIDVKFLSWESGRGGGFSYERSTE